MLAPYVNSYRRLTPDMACPVNNAWGMITARPPSACRSPTCGAACGKPPASSDANPYLALAASLACGWLGIMKEIEPTEPTYDSANEGSIELPRGLLDAVALLEDEPALEEVFARNSSGSMPG